MALPAYRNLFRAARIAFQGDERMLTAARESIRNGFRANAALDPADAEIPAAIQHARDVAQILRQNVVQGKRGNAAVDGDTYHLRIHEATERGDNETIKTAGQKLQQKGTRGARRQQQQQQQQQPTKCCSA